jgi:hypothetical protein
VSWLSRSRGCPRDINSDPVWSRKSVHTNIKQTASGKTLYLYCIYFTASTFWWLRHCVFSLFYNVVLWVRRAASTDLRQALWVTFYWITLGFNLRAHRWGFVRFFIHPLPILIRSTSLCSNSCGFSYHHNHLFDLDPSASTTADSDLFECWCHDRPI